MNNLSSKQNGMGHVGTAMKLNSESIWFNPAAASFQDTRFDISVGITLEPDAIHIMKKSEYSGMFGDYSSFSNELDELSNPESEEEE